MSKLELTQIYLQLKRESNQMCKHVDSATKDLLIEDAREIILLFKPEINVWVSQLAERKIACYELEKLLQLKSSHFTLSKLRKLYSNDDEFENFKSMVVCLLTRTISNSFLENLYKQKIYSGNRFHSEYKW